MNEEKKKIIINTIIALVCVFGGLLYLAYNLLTNKSQDIAWSYWLIFSFIKLNTTGKVMDNAHLNKVIEQYNKLTNQG